MRPSFIIFGSSMKRIITILPILVLSYAVFGQINKQVFHVDSTNGLICICDSVKVGPHYPGIRAELLIAKWGDYTAYGYHAQRLLGFRRQEKRIVLSFESIHGREGLPGKYCKSGGLRYLVRKSNGEVDSSDQTSGSVQFNLNFEVKGEYLLFEFTNLEYIDLKYELGKFEDTQLLGPDGHLLSEKEKLWNRIKIEFYDRFEILCRNLQEFIIGHYRTPEKPIVVN
jgi:hypothetical protein